MRSIEDHEHLINKRNKYGQTPLYVASKNGHLKVIQFFIKEGADPHLTSLIGDGFGSDDDLNKKFNESSIEEESILDVAVRWSHKSVAEYLIQNIDWSRDEIYKATKQSKRVDSKELTNLLKQYARIKHGWCFSTFFC